MYITCNGGYMQVYEFEPIIWRTQIKKSQYQILRLLFICFKTIKLTKSYF
jgi:hypothetical protein